MGDSLTTEWDDTSQSIGILIVLCQTTLIQAYHSNQIAAGRVSRDEDLIGVAAILRDVVHNPRDSTGCIVDNLRYSDVGREAVAYTDNDSSVTQQLLWNMSPATCQTSTVEPHDDRACLGTLGVGDIHTTHLCGIFIHLAIDDIFLCFVLMLLSVSRHAAESESQ